MELLKFVLNNCYFEFENVPYQQVFGCPMGSPVSALLANMVMEYVVGGELFDRLMAHKVNCMHRGRLYLERVHALPKYSRESACTANDSKNSVPQMTISR